MGLFQLKPKYLPATVKTSWMKDAEDWPEPERLVVGESFHMEALTELAGELDEEGRCERLVNVTFVREPGNPYDSNAWRAEIEGRHVGHIGREYAAALAKFGKSAPPFTMAGRIVGGGKRKLTIGVEVWQEARITPGPAIECYPEKN